MQYLYQSKSQMVKRLWIVWCLWGFGGWLMPTPVQATHVAYPDLRVELLTVTPTTVPAGSQFTLSYRIYNAGNAAVSASFYVRAYYTATNTSTTSIAGDTYLNYEQLVTSMTAGGRTSTYTANVSLPPTATTGTGYIKVFADYSNIIYEYTNESNNIAITSITVTPPIPDLSVTSAQVPLEGSAISQNGTFQGKITLQNAGKEFSQDISVKYFYCTTNSVSSCTLELGEEPITYDFPQGGSFTYTSKKLLLPTTNTNTGTGYIRIFVDAKNNISEFNENNNDRLVAVTIVSPRPELQIDQFSVKPDSVFATVPLALSFQLSNTGGTDASNIMIRFYYSPDNTITTADTYLTGSETTISVKAGATSTLTTVTVPTPSSLPISTGYIGMIVDYNNAISEVNEGNNTASSNIRITGVMDITAQSLTTSATYGTAGGNITLSYQLKNTGKASINTYHVGFYYAKTSPVTTAGTLLQTLSFSALSPDFTEFGTATISLPSSLPGGQGYIGMIIDPNNELKEPDRANNQASVQILIAEDKDQDGFPYLPGCPSTLTQCDCDDNDKNTYPGAPEICDGKDNDCNGKIDDGISCAEVPSESSNELLTEVDIDASTEISAEMTPDASTNEAVGEEIPEITAESVPEPSDCYTAGCPQDQVCKNGACVADPCKGINCQKDEFCREGPCVKVCSCCQQGEICVDGKCEKDICHQVQCKTGEVCNKNSGQCESDACATTTCITGKTCSSGVCIDDPCRNIKCPADHRCQTGQCTPNTCSSEIPEEINTTEAFTETTQDTTSTQESAGSEPTPAEALPETSVNKDASATENTAPPETEEGKACGCSQAPASPSLLFVLFLGVLLMRCKQFFKKIKKEAT